MTTPPTPIDPVTAPNAEQDKLGPIPAPDANAATGLGADLRATLVEAFRAAIADAATAAKLPAIDESVHELRKALRRARASVHLVRDTLARDDRRDLTRALADARQLLSATRDLDVAPGVLATVELPPEARATADAIVLAARAAAPSPDEVRRHIEDAAARVAHLADVMAAALPPSIDLGDARDGIAETYRRARGNLRRARRSLSSFHRFRKRAKELTLQLELLSGGIDGRTEAMRRDLAILGEELGAAVDVVMLRGFLEHHAGDTTPEILAPLLDAVDRDLEVRIKAARKGARALFQRRPRRFARKVRRAVRRDHAPPEAAAAPVAQA